MQSHKTAAFRKLYALIPDKIREKSDKAFRLWSKNPSHKSLRYKQVHTTKPVFSVRIDRNWRTLGVKEDSNMIWFWIGKHNEYLRVIANL